MPSVVTPRMPSYAPRLTFVAEGLAAPAARRNAAAAVATTPSPAFATVTDKAVATAARGPPPFADVRVACIAGVVATGSRVPFLLLGHNGTKRKLPVT